MSILPLPPPPSPDELRAIGIRPNEYRHSDTTETWWRVHRTTAVHTLAWNAFRTFGPVLRFDPHPQPRGHHPAHGVWYGATNPGAALGEAFQHDRTIDRAFEIPYLTGLRFTRTLHLLDVSTDSTGHWPPAPAEPMPSPPPDTTTPRGGPAPSSTHSLISTASATTAASPGPSAQPCSPERRTRCRPLPSPHER